MDNVTYIPKTCFQFLYDTLTNQDFQQKTIMVISVSLEIYRVMISSLLLIFVPQNCEDHVCSLLENMNEMDNNYKGGFILNYITVGIFVIMYFTEIRREEKLIKLLEVNPTISSDNESVGHRIKIFADYKKKQLFQVDQQYQYASYIAMFVFIINTIYSWYVIYPHSLGNQTILNFITNILFMVSKLSNVVIIINTDKHIFFSAYLNTKVQFNDIDPREIIKLKKQRTKEYKMESNKELSINVLDTGGFEIYETNIEEED